MPQISLDLTTVFAKSIQIFDLKDVGVCHGVLPTYISTLDTLFPLVYVPVGCNRFVFNMKAYNSHKEYKCSFLMELATLLL